jgi:hypothetical protein
MDLKNVLCDIEADRVDARCHSVISRSRPFEEQNLGKRGISFKMNFDSLRSIGTGGP